MGSKFKPAISLQVRLSLELREKLEALKDETGKSVNQIINEVLEFYLNDKLENDVMDKSPS